MDAASSFPRCSPKLTNKACRRLPSVRRVRTVSGARTRLRRGEKASHSRADSSGNSAPNQSAGGGAARRHPHANEHLRTAAATGRGRGSGFRGRQHFFLFFNPPPPAAFTPKSAPVKQRIHARSLVQVRGLNGRETSRDMHGETQSNFCRMSFTFTST